LYYTEQGEACCKTLTIVKVLVLGRNGGIVCWVEVIEIAGVWSTLISNTIMAEDD
jgi:hypothetical protein